MSSGLSIVLFPLALGIVMLGLGLTLTIGDFVRVAQYPKVVVISLICQMLILPAVCLGLVVAFDLDPFFAVGMMLLAASPGGTTASLYSHLFRGNVALNVTLTAINSILALFTLPLIVNLSVDHFIGSGSSIGLQFDKVLQVFAIVLIPVAIGMTVRLRNPAFAERMQRPVKRLSVGILIVVIVGAVIGVRDQLADSIGSVGLIALIFNAISLLIGYWAPRLMGIERRDSVASSFEIGIHNATLAITIALSPSLLDNSEMSMPPAIYGSLMFFTAALFGYLTARRGAAAVSAGRVRPSARS